MVSKRKTITSLSVILGLSSFFTLTVHAAPSKQVDFSKEATKNLTQVVDPTGVSTTEVPAFAGLLIKGALGLAGLVFLVLIVYAGVRWITSRGNESDIETAKKTIIASVIGLSLIILSYAATDFITKRIVEGNTGAAQDSPVGCCIDWVSASDPNDLTNLAGQLTDPTPASRITTQIDCKTQGENPGGGDFHYGPEGAGNWVFIERINEIGQCNVERDKY